MILKVRVEKIKFTATKIIYCKCSEIKKKLSPFKLLGILIYYSSFNYPKSTTENFCQSPMAVMKKKGGGGRGGVSIV